MKKFFLRTFGCQQNYSDSERIASILENAGFEECKNITEADLIIFNTCSVKKHAEDRVYGFLRNADRLRKQKERQIGITGCMVQKTSTRQSQTKDRLLRKNRYLDFVFRIEDSFQLPQILNNQEFSCTKIGENLDEFFAISPKLSNSYSGFVPIMTGCNNFCTYCIVPYTRGREQSRSSANILQDCQKLLQQGVQEITLLGQNVNAYSADKINFAQLLNQIAQLKGLRRLRFTSPHPAHMTKEVLEVMAKNRNICRHLHLPVQSGSSHILAKMNRSHTRKDFENIANCARQLMPDIAISTDIIVGFPTETEEDYLATKELCHQQKFDMIYISKFSPRQGTLAAKMPDDVPIKIKKERFTGIQEELEQGLEERNSQLMGQKVEVLVEKIEAGVASGKTEQSKIVHFPSSDNLQIGDYASVKITKAGKWFLEGEISQ